MFPTLLTLGGLTISSFGFFLALGFLFATFLVWRLARAWDLPEEKVLDLCLLTFFGSLIGARLLFIAFHFSLFDNVFKVFLLTKYPGLELWGGIIGGAGALYIFARRIRRVDFFQLADLAAVGLLGGLIFGNIGCFMGGCNVGIQSNFLAVSMAGFVGKRFPLQLLEALILTVVLWKIWPVAVRFHFTGKIISLTLIILGVVEFLLEFLRVEKTGGLIFSPLVLILGIFSFYKLGKKDIRLDLANLGKFLVSLLTSEKIRRIVWQKFLKFWYNQKVAFIWSFNQIKKKWLLALRRRRVKNLPQDF